MAGHAVYEGRSDRSFLLLLWSNMKTAFNGLLMAGGIVATFLFWVFKPDTTITLAWFVPFFFLCAILIVTFFSAAIDAHRMNKVGLPAVIYAKSDERHDLLLLLEPSELFSHDVGISVYHRDQNEFEQLIGIGTVINVQTNGMIQVNVNRISGGHEETVQKMRHNDRQILRNLRVKPHVPMSVMWNFDQEVTNG